MAQPSASSGWPFSRSASLLDGRGELRLLGGAAGVRVAAAGRRGRRRRPGAGHARRAGPGVAGHRQHHHEGQQTRRHGARRPRRGAAPAAGRLGAGQHGLRGSRAPAAPCRLRRPCGRRCPRRAAVFSCCSRSRSALMSLFIWQGSAGPRGRLRCLRVRRGRNARCPAGCAGAARAPARQPADHQHARGRTTAGRCVRLDAAAGRARSRRSAAVM